MFKVKLIISISIIVFLVTISDSYSQEAVKNSSENVMNPNLNDLYPSSAASKLYHSSETQFDNVTCIKFELGEEANVILTVSDQNSKVIETLIDESMEAGEYCINYKSSGKIIPGEFTYKLEVKSISGVKNVFAVK